MVFGDKCIDEFDDVFTDYLEEKDNIIEEITHLKICLKEAKLVEEALKNQILEMERYNERLEQEIVSIRKELEKTKGLNLIFAKGSETLEEIIKVKCSPLIKASLGYNGE